MPAARAGLVWRQRAKPKPVITPDPAETLDQKMKLHKFNAVRLAVEVGA